MVFRKTCAGFAGRKVSEQKFRAQNIPEIHSWQGFFVERNSRRANLHVSFIPALGLSAATASTYLFLPLLSAKGLKKIPSDDTFLPFAVIEE
jgi:hypothetical protein